MHVAWSDDVVQYSEYIERLMTTTSVRNPAAHTGRVLPYYLS